MRSRLSLRELQQQAQAHGYTLVPTRIANWQPILISLIRQHRIGYATKLWWEIIRRSDPRADLKTAHTYIEAVCSLNADPPDGTEYPDLPNDPAYVVHPGHEYTIGRLDYYREPWRYRAAVSLSNEVEAHAVHHAEVARLRRWREEERTDWKPRYGSAERRLQRLQQARRARK